MLLWGYSILCKGYTPTGLKHQNKRYSYAACNTWRIMFYPEESYAKPFDCRWDTVLRPVQPGSQMRVDLRDASCAR